MAISFLQDDIHLSQEQWNIFNDNTDSSEFDVDELGTFSFRGEGIPEFDECERNRGIMTYVVEDLDEECFYLFHLNFYFTDHYDTSNNNDIDYTLKAISKSDSLKY
jgi:hypothetical protein